jgi:hypothetical protein
MIKNFLETKTGRNFLVGIAIFTVVVVSLLGYSLLTNKPNQTKASEKIKTTQTQESKEVTGQYNATMYSGKWYSNRQDEMTLDLEKDGTYKASSWLTDGKYYLVDKGILVLEGKDGSTRRLKLQTRMGTTILSLKEDKEETYFYPNEDVKAKMEAEITEQSEAAQQVISQAWLDILQQKSWENSNSKRTFKLEFTDDTITQTKIEEGEKDEKITYQYRIVTMDLNQDGAIFIIQKLDEKGQKEETSFSVKENGSKYVLSGDPGSFNWITIYEKEYQDVTPTQDGTTREEATKK